MTKRASGRRDLSSVIHLSGRFKLSAEQIKDIENGWIILSDSLMAELNQAIDDHIFYSGWKNTALRRGDIDKELKNFKTSLDNLSSFFSDEVTPEKKAALHKITSELYFYYPEDRMHLLSAPNRTPGTPLQELQRLQELQGLHAEVNEDPLAVLNAGPFIDTDRFLTELTYLKVAATRAMNRFEQEGADDKGGRDAADITASLLATINNIFMQAGGIDANRNNFFYQIMKAMGAESPINIEKWNWETVRKSILRAHQSSPGQNPV